MPNTPHNPQNLENKKNQNQQNQKNQDKRSGGMKEDPYHDEDPKSGNRTSRY